MKAMVASHQQPDTTDARVLGSHGLTFAFPLLKSTTRLLAAATLIIAAIGKATDGTPPDWLSDRVAFAGVVWIIATSIEVFVGCMIVLAAFDEIIWPVSIVLFSVLGGVALMLTLNGDPHCNCFGIYEFPPEYLAIYDFCICSCLLVTWKPAVTITVSPQPRRWRVVSLCASFSIATVAILLGSFPSNNTIRFDAASSIGKPLVCLDDIAVGDNLARGTWTIVFYRRGCSQCDALLWNLFSKPSLWDGHNDGPSSDLSHIVIVDVAPHGELLSDAMPAFIHSRLKRGKIWMASVPTVVAIHNGVVTRARTSNTLDWIQAL
jgi:hypothetical protein